MKLLICVLLLACTAAYGAPPRPQRAEHARAGHKPRHVKRRKGAPMTNKPAAPTASPVLDGPNRMEIDPADIPPSERPRDPNVDDRTRIPSEVSPDDKAPPARKPKKRRKNR